MLTKAKELCKKAIENLGLRGGKMRGYKQKKQTTNKFMFQNEIYEAGHNKSSARKEIKK